MSCENCEDKDSCEECDIFHKKLLSAGKIGAMAGARLRERLRSRLGWRELTDSERDANLEYNLKDLQCPTTLLGHKVVIDEKLSMPCKHCDECTAWNPFPWIEGGKMCEWIPGELNARTTDKQSGGPGNGTDTEDSSVRKAD